MRPEIHICLGTTPTIQRTMVFDRLVIGEVNRAREVLVNASGKSINVARVLKILGEKAVACAPLGGMTGRIARSDLAESGIDCRLIRTKSPTRTCVTVIDKQKRTATELVQESGPMTRAESDCLLAAMAKLLGRAKMLVLSGSLASGAPADFYGRCCAAARKKNVAVILDARGRELLAALESEPMVVKLNREELGMTLGRKIDGSAALRRGMLQLHEAGAKWVIITLGSDGASAYDGKRFWKITPPKVKAISAVGSGDAFAAGLSAGIARGEAVPEACRLAAACGAANAMMPGAGRMDARAALALVARVRVD